MILEVYPDLRDIREEKGLSRRELALMAGVSISTIRTIEVKRNFATYMKAIENSDFISKTNFETVVRICVVLGYMRPGIYSFKQVLKRQRLFNPAQITDRGRRPQGIPQDSRKMAVKAA